MAVMRADRTACEKWYDRFLPEESVTYPMVRGRLLGLLAQAMSEIDKAVTHFENALAFRHEAGYRPVLAWTCCDYADALRERDGLGDRVKAKSLLDESLGIFRELGMRPLIERVLSRREILQA